MPKLQTDRRSQNFQTYHGSKALDTQSQVSVAQQHHTFWRYDTYGKNHPRRCYFERRNCYSCGKVGHFQRDNPFTEGNAEGAKSQATSMAPSPKGAPAAFRSSRNQFYALTNHQEAKASIGVVTDTLQIFSRDIYVCLIPGLPCLM